MGKFRSLATLSVIFFQNASQVFFFLLESAFLDIFLMGTSLLRKAVLTYFVLQSSAAESFEHIGSEELLHLADSAGFSANEQDPVVDGGMAASSRHSGRSVSEQSGGLVVVEEEKQINGQIVNEDCGDHAGTEEKSVSCSFLCGDLCW